MKINLNGELKWPRTQQGTATAELELQRQTFYTIFVVVRSFLSSLEKANTHTETHTDRTLIRKQNKIIRSRCDRNTGWAYCTKIIMVNSNHSTIRMFVVLFSVMFSYFGCRCYWWWHVKENTIKKREFRGDLNLNRTEYVGIWPMLKKEFSAHQTI